MFEQLITNNAGDIQVALFFGLFFIIAAVEGMVPKRFNIERKERWIANLVLTTINIAVLSLLPVTFFGVAVWTHKVSFGLFNWIAMPTVFAIAGNLLARGFISFLTHYLFHKVPVLWRIHRVHHFDTDFDVSTTVRFHPFELIVNLLLGVPIVVALGLSPWVLLLYEIVDAAVTLFSHANIRLPKSLDRRLRYVIVTPDLHRIHHSSWQPETDSNFSAVFPIWDIIFGTFRTQTREQQETMELGLEVRDGREQNVGWLLLSPMHDTPESQDDHVEPETAK